MDHAWVDRGASWRESERSTVYPQCGILRQCPPQRPLRAGLLQLDGGVGAFDVGAFAVASDRADAVVEMTGVGEHGMYE